MAINIKMYVHFRYSSVGIVNCMFVPCDTEYEYGTRCHRTRMLFCFVNPVWNLNTQSTVSLHFMCSDQISHYSIMTLLHSWFCELTITEYGGGDHINVEFLKRTQGILKKLLQNTNELTLRCRNAMPTFKQFLFCCLQI